MTQSISVDELARNFGGYSQGDVLSIDIGGSVDLPVKVDPAAGSDALIVVFHGAVNRDKRPYPAFLNFRAGLGHAAHQIAIADAALGLDPELPLSWYAGAPGLPLQELLPPLFHKLQYELQVEKLIFMGSSGGGFAALFYSWHCPGSVAIVQVPQTNILEYHLPGAFRRYSAVCWPEGGSSNEFAPILDLRELYTMDSGNSVVYIQSTLDGHHLHRQMLPFLASLPAGMNGRVVVKSSFWGRTGHSNVVPNSEWDGWAKAALAAESLDAESLVLAYEALAIEKVPKVGRNRSPVGLKAAGTASRTNSSVRQHHDDQDLAWANLVAESQLAAYGVQ